MESTLTKTIKFALTLLCALTVIFFSTTDGVLGQTMTMSPYKICLNTNGQFDNFQAVIPMTLESGYMFSSCEATLYIDGQFIADSYGAKYCYIDNKLQVYFDRNEVLSNPVLEELTGATHTAMVEGTLEMVSADGSDYISRGFTAYDDVIIYDPNKK
ncbi:MAG: hypothetical protein JSV52_11670 [Candidatus Zixiibacteriota bacterium]|nr:MAG: hypothetical protein JSV52_11670 [candidate division Zixibacteria bacterium]